MLDLGGGLVLLVGREPAGRGVAVVAARVMGRVALHARVGPVPRDVGRTRGDRRLDFRAVRGPAVVQESLVALVGDLHLPGVARVVAPRERPPGGRGLVALVRPGVVHVVHQPVVGEPQPQILDQLAVVGERVRVEAEGLDLPLDVAVTAVVLDVRAAQARGCRRRDRQREGTRGYASPPARPRRFDASHNHPPQRVTVERVLSIHEGCSTPPSPAATIRTAPSSGLRTAALSAPSWPGAHRVSGQVTTSGVHGPTRTLRTGARPAHPGTTAPEGGNSRSGALPWRRHRAPGCWRPPCANPVSESSS